MRPLLLVLLAACNGADDGAPAPSGGEGGLTGDGVLLPYPSRLLLDEQGHHVALPADLLPHGDTPFDVERVAWRTGFSPAQIAVARVPNPRPEALPRWDAPVLTGGSVRLIDLTDGVEWPAFAELDANDDEDPLLVIRPLAAMVPDHTMAVVVTRAAADRPEVFDALLAGNPPEGLEVMLDRTRLLMASLADFGLAEDDVALAWDFPISDGRLPLRTALGGADLPDSHTFTTFRDADEGDTVPDRTWRAAEGTFRVTDFLVDDRAFDLDHGVARPVGETDAVLYAHIPDSVRDAAPGTVPVMVFGHGFLASPAYYLDDVDDESNLIRLADEGGFIVIGTLWRGLCTPDLVGALEAAGDPGTIHQLTDRLSQGVVNTVSLVRYAAEGDLLDDPFFGGLADPDQVFYYGISLGGIHGAVVAAQDLPLRAAALHVPGGFWTTMLRRSSHWATFRGAFDVALTEPHDQQLAVAAFQLYFDPADPALWAQDLTDRTILYQESVHDEQVPNIATRAMARSMGLPQLRPMVVPVVGLDPVDAPLPAGSRAYVQFDPGKAAPPDGNEPAPVTNAHTTPRLWDGTMTQVLHFLDPAGPGVVVHACGEGPCTEEHPGTILP